MVAREGMSRLRIADVEEPLRAWFAAGLLLWGCCGCGSSGGELPLRLSRTDFYLGSVQQGAGAMELPLELTVWDKSAVTIEEARSGCNCVRMLPNLAGRQLSPGSRHAVVLVVDPPRRPGMANMQVWLITRPASQQPLKLTVAARVRLSPESTPRALAITAPLGTGPAATLNIHYYRERTERPLTLDEEASVFGLLTLRDSRMETEKFEGLQEHERRDHLHLELEGPDDLPIGEHTGEIRLAWKGDLPVTVVPVRLQVVHPLGPSLERLFCGFLQPGQGWSSEVPLVRMDRNVRLASAASNLPYVQAQLLPGDRLAVHVTAPPIPGRFEGRIELTFAGRDAPVIHLPISGVVGEP